jgi:hypothetical protein
VTKRTPWYAARSHSSRARPNPAARSWPVGPAPARIDGGRTHEASTSRSRGGTPTLTVNAINPGPPTINSSHVSCTRDQYDHGVDSAGRSSAGGLAGRGADGGVARLASTAVARSCRGGGMTQIPDNCQFDPVPRRSRTFTARTRRTPGTTNHQRQPVTCQHAVQSYASFPKPWPRPSRMQAPDPHQEAYL